MMAVSYQHNKGNAATILDNFRLHSDSDLSDDLPGDADENGVVNAADYMALKRHMGTPSGALLADGDFDGDNNVDYDDLQMLIGNYDAVSTSQAIPEPATLFVMLAAGLPALLKRRRSPN